MVVYIIDDNKEFVNSIRTFLEENYKNRVSFFPKKGEEHDNLTMDIRLLANENTQDIREKRIEFVVSGVIEKCENDRSIVMIDLNLIGSGKDDRGKEIYNRLKKTITEKKLAQMISLYVVSLYSYRSIVGIIDVDSEHYIQKEGDDTEGNFNDIFKDKINSILKKYPQLKDNDESRANDKNVPSDISGGIDNQSNNELDEKYYKGYSVGYDEGLSDGKKKIKENLKTNVAKWIGVFLQLLAFFFLIGAVFDIAYHTLKLNTIIIAERLFIAFLPALILFGLYVFYERSIKPYIEGPVNPKGEEDINKTIAIFHLTKKLFILSLISYLFLKLVEIIFVKRIDSPDSSNSGKNFFAKLYEKVIPDSLQSNHSENYITTFAENFDVRANPLFIIYITAGLIVLLMVFYLIIDRSHHSKD